MDFPSIPTYLDPANWQQQPGPQMGSSSGGAAAGPQILPPQPLPQPPHQPPHVHAGGGTSLIRPGSMADRARMANMPMPEAALKCPRCDSTNTKFCYFNNYSLSQPRHFCKTCRRYWTRGGALRNVPVGGGCRRNKRSKGSSSKSPISGDRAGSAATNSSSSTPNSGVHNDTAGLSPQIPPLRFMAPLHQLPDFSSGVMGLNYGLNYNSLLSGPISTAGDLDFAPGHAGLGVGSGFGSGSVLGAEHWRLPQTATNFAFLSGLDTSPGLFEASSYVGPARQKTSSSGISGHLASVKMEENQDQVNLAGRQFLQGMSGSEQLWSGTSAWSYPSGFSSSSPPSNPL